MEKETNEARKNRRKQTGEVFTPNDTVRYMLNRLPEDVFTENKMFLDNSAGNGNFILTIIGMKVEHGVSVEDAIRTTFGTELMEDNVIEMKERIMLLAKELCPECNLERIKQIVDHNIVCTDAFAWDYKHWCKK